MVLLGAGCAGGEELVGDDGGCVDGKCDDALASTDVAATRLEIDLGARTGKATIELERTGTVAFEVAGLEIASVRDGRGNRRFTIDDGKLFVTNAYPPIEIGYSFEVRDMADGLLAGGSTVLWPYWCGNVFPCHSAPADGQQFELELTGVPSGQRAIAPTAIAADAPAYQIAWAVGAYESQLLGTTPAGTRVGVHWLPRGKTKALAGTRDLVAIFDWLETNLGPYMFGDDVSSVAVVWGEGMYGGMEHHPHWHVAVDAMDDAETHAHEAAHGWFGDGVRIRCWEDFVLSEGTVSYLTARAIGEVNGPDAEAAVWAGYQEELDAERADGDRVSWPAGCNRVDILRDGLFSNLPYMEGAFFYKAVADAIGVAELDAILSSFYLAHRGAAASMQDMLDAIESASGFDPTPLATTWLR